MFPVQLHFQVNEQCNLRCPGCYLPDRTGRGRGAAEIDETVFGPAAAAGGVFCTLTGGEPLLHPEITEICRRAAARFGHVLVVCNGTLLDAAMVRALREAGVSSVRVSLDSVRPELHDALRGKPGTFETVAANLRGAAGTLDLGIITTVTDRNVGELATLARWAVEAGLNHAAFQPYHPYCSVYPAMQPFESPAYDEGFFAALDASLRDLETFTAEHPGVVETPRSMLERFPAFFRAPGGVDQVCGADRYLFVNSSLQARGCLFCEPLGSLQEEPPPEFIAGDAYRAFDNFRNDCTLCLMGCQYAGPETRALEAGWETFRRGDFGAAAAHFAESQQLAPSTEAALGAGLSTGWARIAAGDYTAAEAHFRPLAAETGAAEAEHGLGAALLWQERPEEARALLEPVAKRAPYLTAVFGDLSTACRLSGDLEAAVHWGRKALAVFPDSQYAHHQLGLTLRQAKREPEALLHFERSATLTPDNPWVRFDYGLSLWKGERHDEAVAEFRAALAIDDAQPWFHMLLAHALKDAGRMDEARGAAQVALEKNAGADPVLMSQAGELMATK